MSNQTKSNFLNYFIDSTFTKVNKVSVLSFKNEEDRISFSKYYLLKVEIKDLNVLSDEKPFFEIPVENKVEAYEQLIEMSKNNDYITSKLLIFQRSLETSCKRFEQTN